MGLWRHSSFSPQDPGYKMMELYIETLTGAVFELRVSPYESVMDVKARIQKLEGIPMSQQHLIWQTQELDDEYSLHDYAIQDGATLKLVLTMRGGPINTRRVPVEDAASLREMAEYFSAAAAADGAREEMAQQPTSNRPVTVIVYQNGDQVNFFRVVDRDAATSPTAESLSGASMYNLYDEDDAEDVEGLKEKLEDNDKTKGKMKLLRSKMENMIITKKPKNLNPSSTNNSTNNSPPSSQPNSGVKKPPAPPQLIPHPPSTSRPHSMSRLSRRFPSASAGAGASQGPNLLNRNPCLPPVGQDQDSNAALRFAQLLKEKEEANATTTTTTTITSLPTNGSSAPTNRLNNDSNKPSRLMGPLTSVKEDEPIENIPPPPTSSVTEANDYTPDVKTQQEVLEHILRQAHSVRSPRKWEYSSDVLLRETSAKKPSTAAGSKGQKDSSVGENSEAVQAASSSTQRPVSTSSNNKPRGVERLWSNGGNDVLAAASSSQSTTSNPLPPPPPVFPTARTTSAAPAPKRQLSLDAFAESLASKPGTASSKRERKAGVSAAGASSGVGGRGVVLESLDINEVRVMSGFLKSYVQRTSATASRTTPTGGGKEGRRTPDGRLLSGRPTLSRLGSGGGGGRVSPRLAPMKHKKKNTKRCFLCGKKTGLATSYQCRCGENFCATHRYAESHSCTFDYKTEGRKILQQSNPVVTAPKLPKI